MCSLVLFASSRVRESTRLLPFQFGDVEFGVSDVFGVKCDLWYVLKYKQNWESEKIGMVGL